MENLVRALKNYGSVGIIKHLHEHNINNPGTDTWKHASAGTDIVIGVTQSEHVKFSRENIVVAAAHREQLFPVLREAIEHLKAQVPIWKKEHTQNGEFWIHDTNNN